MYQEAARLHPAVDIIIDLQYPNSQADCRMKRLPVPTIPKIGQTSCSMIPNRYLCALIASVLCGCAVSSISRAQVPSEDEFTLYYSQGDSTFYKRTYRADPPVLLPYGQLRLSPNTPPILERHPASNYDLKLQLLLNEKAYLQSTDGEDEQYVKIDARNRIKAEADRQLRIQQQKAFEEQQAKFEQERQERERQAKIEQERQERERLAKIEQERQERERLAKGQQEPPDQEQKKSDQKSEPGFFVRQYEALSNLAHSLYTTSAFYISVVFDSIYGFVTNYWTYILTGGSGIAFLTAMYGFITKRTARLFFIGIKASGKTALHTRLTHPHASEHDILDLNTTEKKLIDPTPLETTIRLGRYTFAGETLDHSGQHPGLVVNRLQGGVILRRFLEWKKPVILIAVLSCTTDNAQAGNTNKIDDTMVVRQTQYFSDLTSILLDTKYITRPAGCIIFVTKADLFSDEAMDVTRTLYNALRKALATPINVIEGAFAQRPIPTEVIVGSAIKSWHTTTLLERCVKLATTRQKG
jgi:hypothetical protein